MGWRSTYQQDQEEIKRLKEKIDKSKTKKIELKNTILNLKKDISHLNSFIPEEIKDETNDDQLTVSFIEFKPKISRIISKDQYWYIKCIYLSFILYEDFYSSYFRKLGIKFL